MVRISLVVMVLFQSCEMIWASATSPIEDDGGGGRDDNSCSS